MTKEKNTAANELLNIILGKINGLLVFFVVYFIYILTVFPTVQTEDSGELITSAVKLDIAHPPGYPLYVLVGKLFSILVPFGNMGWRINIMSAFFGALTAQILYVIIKKRSKNELIAFGGALLYAFSSIIWGQSNRAEVYTLNTFFVALIIYLLMRWNDEKKDRWLLLTALAFGLGVGDHHTLLLAAPAMGIYVLVKNWKTIINPKIVLGCIGLLAVGLSVYAYIPIRTYMAPYDNPAFIDHSGLYTWDKFIGFVNRSIYGGTVFIPLQQATQEASVEHLPAWMLGIKDFFSDYGGRFINNNIRSFVPLFKIIFGSLLYIPLFFILPGLYHLLKKDWQWGLFIIMLFLCFTTLLMVFTPINSDINDFLAFSTEPFMMPSLVVLTIITCEGFAWFKENIKNKKLAMGFSVLCLMPGAFGLGKNFPVNDESNNYVAYDFNKLTLESVPQNGYLISIGRDNMTFPLYYLRKVEQLRPDIHLEIYYSTAPVDEMFLRNRVDQNGGKPVFIDLLPPNYASMDLKPYNFVYEYGANATMPPSIPAPPMPGPQNQAMQQNPVMRGIRADMDFPDTRLKMLYYIKLGIMYANANTTADPAKKQAAFDQVFNASGDNSYYINIIGDYAFSAGDFETAKKAYLKSKNAWGVQKVDDKVSNPNSIQNENVQNGMS